MIEEEIELSDEDIIVIVDESEEAPRAPRRYDSDPDYGSDPQWHAPDTFEGDWDDGEVTEPLKEVR